MEGWKGGRMEGWKDGEGPSLALSHFGLGVGSGV